jgi:hypothetical protein
MNEHSTPQDIDENQLLSAWVQLQYAHRERKPLDSLLWAHAVLDEICDKNPRVCLRLIVLILERDPSDFIMGNLAAGPLEDLLCRYGPSIIDAVEAEAEERKNFRQLLGRVWRNTIEEDVWNRIEAIRASDGGVH